MTPPPVFRDKESMRHWCNASRSDGKKVALVPTMGYLHNGHLSLVATAREAGADVVVVRRAVCGVLSHLCDMLADSLESNRLCLLAQVSIYVNPTQFAVGEDLDTYPRDPEGDHAKLASVGVDAVFEPQTLYAPDSEPAHETCVTVENLQVRPDESLWWKSVLNTIRVCPTARHVWPEPANALPGCGHCCVQAVQHREARHCGASAPVMWPPCDQCAHDMMM